jgi:molecular chaperone DnaK
MVEESVAHAFDDLRARQWIEAKIRAGETLAATRKGLAECAKELDAAYQKQVADAMAAVEAVLAEEDPKTKVGDPAKLKAANAALDAATQKLAEIMMDKAMEEMLRKKGLIS